MTRTRATTAALTLAVLFAAGTACGGDDPSGPGGEASLSVLITDAPGSVDRVWVQVRDVAVFGDALGVGGSRTVVERAGLVELTALQGSTRTLVSGASLPAGRYTDVRVDLGHAYLLTDGGEVHATKDRLPADVAAEVGTSSRDGPLACPTCSLAGIRVPIRGSREFSGAASVLLDFDVAESFARSPDDPDFWVMEPSLAGVRLADAAEVSGEVALGGGVSLDGDGTFAAPNCTEASPADFVPQAEGGDGRRSGTLSGGSPPVGYTIDGLAPGSYGMGFKETVSFRGEEVTFSASSTPGTLELESGGSATVDYTITGVSCQGT